MESTSRGPNLAFLALVAESERTAAPTTIDSGPSTEDLAALANRALDRTKRNRSPDKELTREERPLKRVEVLQPSETPVLALERFQGLMNKINGEWKRYGFCPIQNIIQHSAPVPAISEDDPQRWTMRIVMPRGQTIEMVTSYEDYCSTVFAADQEGMFYYFELFELSPDLSRRVGESVVCLRSDPARTLGEWQWVRASDVTDGRTAMKLMRLIESSLAIPEIDLTDSSKIKDPVRPELNIELRIPIAICQDKPGWYANAGFTVCHVADPIESSVEKDGKLISYQQDPEQYRQSLTWLQNLSIGKIYSLLFKGDKTNQKKFAEIATFFVNLNGQSVSKSDLTLRFLFSTITGLSRNMQFGEIRQKALQAYSFVYHNILIPTTLGKRPNKLQKEHLRHTSIVKMAMYMKARRDV